MPSWGNRKPPFGTLVDPGHPLAQNLVGASSLAEGIGARAWGSLRTDGLLPLQSGAVWAPGRGLLTSAVGAGAYGTTPASMRINPPVSIFWRGQVLATPVNSANLFNVSYDNANGSPYVGYGFYYVTGPLIQVGWNDGSFLRTCNMAAIPTVNQVYSVAATIYKGPPADSVKTYFNAQADNTAAGGIATTIAYAASSLAIIGQPSWGSGVNCQHLHHCVYVWNRILSPTEIRWLHAEPYALFLFPRSRRPGLVMAASAGGGNGGGNGNGGSGGIGPVVAWTNGIRQRRRKKRLWY